MATKDLSLTSPNYYRLGMKCLKTDLQIRDGIEDNSKIIFVKPTCGERVKVVTVSFWCMCM